MDWIFLSPHFDDVAFSCGGLLWELVQAGNIVHIWTVCAGDPLPGELSAFAQEHHLRWGIGERAVTQRKQEDQLACLRLGATYRHLPIPDCLYRRTGEDYFRKPRWCKNGFPQGDSRGEHLYPTLEAIFGPLRTEEDGLVRQLSAELTGILPARCRLVCPLTLGGHTDHRLTRRATEALSARSGALWYYADYPYVLKATSELDQLKNNGWHSVVFSVSAAGAQAWYEAMVAYHSQFSTFWEDLPALRYALETYLKQNGGVTLWQPAAL